MKTRFFRALWGLTEADTLSGKMKLCADAGYDGIEAAIPAIEPAAWRDLCARYNLVHVVQIYASTVGEFRDQYERALPYRPVVVNAHTGRDKFTIEEGRDFFREALRIEADGGVVVGHETHRRRMLFNPWATAAYLSEFPNLKITADFSHWTCVCESMLMDMEHEMALACRRAILVHGRVGWEQSPQVPDPRAPEHASHLAAFERWWDCVRANHLAAHAATQEFTVEFGPPPYMPRLPYTLTPVADLWEVCLWMRDRQRERWGQFTGQV